MLFVSFVKAIAAILHKFIKLFVGLIVKGYKFGLSGFFWWGGHDELLKTYV